MRTRRALFLIAAAVFGFLFVWGLSGLPSFGDYRGPYGIVLGQVVMSERHATEAVGATTFDYRGFDCASYAASVRRKKKRRSTRFTVGAVRRATHCACWGSR
jgi:hypothetical protein